MNILQAAYDTLSAARVVGMGTVVPIHPELGYPHLAKMVEEMETGQLSEDKMNRYLGWIQAAVVASSGLTLDDIKKINKAVSHRAT